MLGSSDTFWERFLDLTSSGPDMLTAVCQHMSSVERQALHSVNRAMRTAMNATVTTICCSQITLPTHQQLHEVFPNLSSMHLCINGVNLLLNDWQVHLRQLVHSSQLLLNKLRHLSLVIRPARMVEAAEIQTILELLTR
jgi:hypothetical protein